MKTDTINRCFCGSPATELAVTAKGPFCYLCAQCFAVFETILKPRMEAL